MIPPASNCVFDCNIFFQSLISGTGPSSECLIRARTGAIRLHISQYVIDELLDVCTRPHIQQKFGVTAEQAAAFIQELRSFALLIDQVPSIYVHPHDPDDSHYIDLAVATGSQLIVSRDRHLRLLMDLSRREAQDFHSRFPDIRSSHHRLYSTN